MNNEEYFGPSLVDIAYEIINMQKEINTLRAENKRLLQIEKKYDELLASSLKHSQTMAGNMLKCLLTPGVTKSLAENGTFTS